MTCLNKVLYYDILVKSKRITSVRAREKVEYQCLSISQ